MYFLNILYLFIIVMSLRKYTDYNSYLTKIKFDNLGCYLSEKNFRYVEAQIISLQNTVNNDYLKVRLDLAYDMRRVDNYHVDLLEYLKGLAIADNENYEYLNKLIPSDVQ